MSLAIALSLAALGLAIAIALAAIVGMLSDIRDVLREIHYDAWKRRGRRD